MAGPLCGLRLIDFTTLLPGPYATMTLADLGAEVLRVCSGSRPDMAALLPPFLPDSGLSCAAAFLGRNKRCLTLNLKDPRAGEIVCRLLAEYDILIEQFRPGVLAKLGLGYETLKAVNPRLIYCSLTGYGQTGPLALRAGHDINYLARSGLMDYSGRKDGGPCLTGMQIADVASGSMNAVVGILAAVIHRQRTGEGQHIDVSMTDGVAAFNALAGAALLAGGAEPRREEEILNGGSLYDFYETADGGHLAVGGLEPQFFTAFCRAIGRPDLAAGGMAPPRTAEVKEEVRAIIRSRTRAEWMEIFGGIDACVEPVLSLGEALTDAQAAARGRVVAVPLPGGGVVRQPAHPVRFSASAPEYRHAGVPAGAHNREILSALGYSDAEVADFEQTGLFR